MQGAGQELGVATRGLAVTDRGGGGDANAKGELGTGIIFHCQQGHCAASRMVIGVCDSPRYT